MTVSAEGISADIQIGYTRTCVLRISHHGTPHLVEFSIIEESAALLLFGKPFMYHLGIEVHNRPRKIISHDVQSITMVPSSLSEALDFRTVPPNSSAGDKLSIVCQTL